MAERSTLAKLPAATRQQLNSRLRADCYCNILATTAWLATKGVQVGKTTVGAYAKRLADEDAVRAAVKDPGAAHGAAADLRLACLDIAQRCGGTQASILRRAQAYLRWVTTGGTPPRAGARPTKRPAAPRP